METVGQYAQRIRNRPTQITCVNPVARKGRRGERAFNLADASRKRNDDDQIREGPHPERQRSARHRQGRSGPRPGVPAAPPLDVAAIRKKLGLSQQKFAARFGLSAALAPDWEQKRRNPDQAARTLLTVIARDPEAVEKALSAA
jgi:putative transcriptional regulator